MTQELVRWRQIKYDCDEGDNDDNRKQTGQIRQACKKERNRNQGADYGGVARNRDWRLGRPRRGSIAKYVDFRATIPCHLKYFAFRQPVNETKPIRFAEYTAERDCPHALFALEVNDVAV